jgi:CRISPR/Cas system-associated exonuclease Cas4 (RecB family)
MAYVRNPAYKPGQTAAYKISRSKIDLFMQCPRCFWLDNRLKIKRPSGPPFQINKAVDELLKKEFDVYRLKREPHPWSSTKSRLCRCSITTSINGATILPV